MGAANGKKEKKNSSDAKKMLAALQGTSDRDILYTELLENYKNNKERVDTAQFHFKIFFFIITCVIFISVVLIGSLTILRISKKANISWQDMGTALAGLASIISAVTILPSKIAENLFPASGNSESVEFIKSMQSFDLSPKPKTQKGKDEQIEGCIEESVAAAFDDET